MGSVEGGRKSVGVGQPSPHGDEKDAHMVGDRRAPAGDRPGSRAVGTGGRLVVVGVGGAFEIVHSAGDQLLRQPRVQAHGGQYRSSC